MSRAAGLKAEEAIERLIEGNKKYLALEKNTGDISYALRLHTSVHGQAPYAVIVTCSDSRVIPESIFSAGIGELFVIRVAGNVIGDHELGSIQYAAGHLGCRLAVVMGHTGCGAVGAAISGGAEGFISSITDEIKLAIGGEKDDYKAGCLNVKRSMVRIAEGLHISGDNEDSLRVAGAMYHINTGEVEFL